MKKADIIEGEAYLVTRRATTFDGFYQRGWQTLYKGRVLNLNAQRTRTETRHGFRGSYKHKVTERGILVELTHEVKCDYSDESKTGMHYKIWRVVKMDKPETLMLANGKHVHMKWVDQHDYQNERPISLATYLKSLNDDALKEAKRKRDKRDRLGNLLKRMVLMGAPESMAPCSWGESKVTFQHRDEIAFLEAMVRFCAEQAFQHESGEEEQE